MIPASAAIGDLVDVRGGGTPSKANAEFWAGTIPWVSPKDMKHWEIVDSEDKITEEAIRGSATNLIPTDAILVVNRSGILKRTLPVGITRRPVAINQDIKALVCRPNVCPEYLAYMVKAAEPIVLTWVRATTADNFSIDSLRSLEIPLPPLDEQRRIAAILDIADALRRKRKRALDLLDSLTQSIFLEMFVPGEHPEIELKDAVKKGTIVTYGIVQAGPEFEGGIPYIRTSDIKDGSINQFALRHTDPNIASRFARSRVGAGEIVMSIRATVGTTAIVPPALDGANLTQGTARIAPGEELNVDYLLAYLRSNPIQQWLKAQVKGATFLEITLGRLRELPVAVPPLPLQRTFVEKVDAIKLTLASAVSQSGSLNGLFSSLQSRAFSGQL